MICVINSKSGETVHVEILNLANLITSDYIYYSGIFVQYLCDILPIFMPECL